MMPSLYPSGVESGFRPYLAEEVLAWRRLSKLCAGGPSVRGSSARCHSESAGRRIWRAVWCLRLEQRTLPPRRTDSEVLVGQLRRHSPAWCAVEESNLNQKGLIDLFDRLRLFGQHRRQGVHAHWPALILLDDREQQLAVNFVKTVAVDLEHLQRRLRRRQIDLSCAADLRVIAHPAQQTIGDARRSPRTAGDLKRSRPVNRHAQNLGGPLDNDPQVLVTVKFQPQHNPETRTQGR